MVLKIQKAGKSSPEAHSSHESRARFLDFGGHGSNYSCFLLFYTVVKDVFCLTIVVFYTLYSDAAYFQKP